MAVDWSSYKLSPDFSGLAQGIQNYGLQKQQSAQFQQEMDYKNRALAADEAYKQATMQRGSGKNQLWADVFQGPDGRYYRYGSDPQGNLITNALPEGVSPITSSGSFMLNNSQEIANAEALKAQQVEQAKLGEQLKIKPTIASQERTAINAADIKSIYEKTLLQKQAENQGVLAAAAEKANTGYEMMTPLFEQVDSVLADKKKEIYSGTTWDYIVGTAAPKVGAVFDQDKLNNTVTVRQNIATLRTMSKPVGSGNPTEGEWARFDGMLPDPNTATRGELVTGYNNYTKAVKDWYKQNQQRATGQKVESNPNAFVPQTAPTQGAQPQSINWSDY